MVLLWLALLVAAPASLAATQADVERALTVDHTVVLPPGITEIQSEIVLPVSASGRRILGHPSGSILRAGSRFRGRALLVVQDNHHVSLEGFSVDGSRAVLTETSGLPPSDRSFAGFYVLNGILVLRSRNVSIERVRLGNIVNYPVLVSACEDVRVERIAVTDSGSLNAKGRNNASGGVLFEDGTSRFVVRRSSFTRIGGNGVWTHSRYTSPRNSDGEIVENRFAQIGRDAIQVGHATRVQVQRNTGTRIGYPVRIVDVEGGGIPVAIDTAGNVDKTSYSFNSFSEINGKCIDLDGFHNGEVRANTCTNRLAANDYPHGHYGIVMNNSNPDMESRNIKIVDNVIDGTKFGGIFVIGRSHTISGNRLSRLNLAGCNESAERFGCLYNAKEPGILQAGIYFGLGAERPDPASNNVVTRNRISGHKMAARCIAAAPGVDLKSQKLENNTCRNQSR